MKAMYIYNPHSEVERNKLDAVRKELLNVLQEVTVMDIDQAKDIFHITRTPALIIIREDLQGEHLLDEIEDGFRIIGEVYKVGDEEQKNLFNQDGGRIDNYIFNQKKQAEDALLGDMLERGVI